MATTIPQRELRNQAGAVLRRVEQGERFTITVDGRPVAELGPLPGAQEPATLADLATLIAGTPVDAGWTDELLTERAEDEAAAVDPWAQ
jgi:prevent-host-death family protein